MPKTKDFEKFVRKDLFRGRQPKIAGWIWSVAALAVLVLLISKR